jgi:hypothetical protein
MSTSEITLTRDSRAVALQKLREVQQALGTLVALLGLGRETLDAGLTTNVLKVAEFGLADVGKTLGIETDGVKEREERYAMLRAANLRVRELEAQLGSTIGADVMQAGLTTLDARLNSWWDLEGFGHLRNIAFQRYGCTVNFSCSLFGDFRGSDSATPVSAKERRALWHASLAERGFNVVQEDLREWALEDCDGTRKVLLDLIAQRLPSARVLKLENSNRATAGGFILQGVEVYIEQLADILALPEKKAS